MISAINPTASDQSQAAPPLRTSALLRSILTSNPDVKTFSVERILAAIGSDRVEASLMIMSLPAIVPIPTSNGIASVPMGALAGHLASGQKHVRLPRFILKKSISRRALAVAIHAALPILEAAEKVVRPRWNWVNSASSRRAVGLFVLLLALANAYPLLGFNPLHAASIFVVALGMAEQDGLAVLLGVVVGVLSLIVLASSGLSARALRSKAGAWLRKIGRKLGLEALANYLRKRGYKRLAVLLTFQWSTLLLLWDPEKKSAPVPVKVVRAVAKRAPSLVNASVKVNTAVASNLTRLHYSSGSNSRAAVGI